MEVGSFVQSMNKFEIDTWMCCPNDPVDLFSTLNTVFIMAIVVTASVLLQSSYQAVVLWPQRPWHTKTTKEQKKEAEAKEKAAKENEIDELGDPVHMRRVILVSNGLSHEASRRVNLLTTTACIPT